jgi:hypothetical protein
MDSPDREKWIQAMDKEMETLQEKGCWEIAIIPTRRRINLVRSFFVYKVKKDQNGNCIKWKARLVAKGSSQIHGVDFWETYSLVARLATLRTLLAVAAIEGMITHQLDISSAYIQSWPKVLAESLFGRYCERMGMVMYNISRVSRL